MLKNKKGLKGHRELIETTQSFTREAVDSVR